MTAIFNACRARLAESLVVADSTLPLLILVPEHSPSQEQKCLTLAKRLSSGLASAQHCGDPQRLVGGANDSHAALALVASEHSALGTLRRVRALHKP